MQNNTLSRADLSYDSGVAMNVHYGDILVKFGEVLDIKSERLPMIVDETVLDKYKSSFLKNGDIIIADTAEDETVGKCTEIAGLSDEYVISGLHTIPYRPLQKFAFGYLGYYMNSTSYHNQLLPLMQGIKVTSISKVSLQNTVIIYPKSKVEQAAIGKYFYNLDNLITLHQRKILLDKYFLTIDWEQRKLGEIFKYEQPQAYIVESTDYDEKNNIPVLTAGQSFILGYTNEQFGIKEASGRNPVIIFDDFTTSSHYVDFPFKVKSSAIKLLSLNNPNDNMHCAYNVLQCIGYLPVSHERHWISIFSKFDVLLPKSIDEQEQIGQYLANLDNLITLHQWKCMISRKNIVYAWEQRKLGDCTFLSGKKNKNNLNLEPYAITNEHGFIPQNKAHDEFGYMKDTDRRAYNIVSKNSFAYNPARINIGSIGYYKGTENVIISSLYEVFQTVDSVYDPFLWQWFKTKDFQNWIIRLQEGSVRLYFYYDKLCECIIRMPKLEEQIKIANYFEALDNLITLHQWECIVCTKIKVNTSIQCKFIKIGVKLQKCILLSIILLFKRRKISCIFYVNILLRFIKVIELEIELIFGIIDGTIIVIFYLKIRCLYLNIFCTFIFKFNK